jgi:hypothetical protein
MTSDPMGPDRPVNLYDPVDSDFDAGAHGNFDDQAGGFMDRSFLKSLPHTAELFSKAVARTVSEKRRLLGSRGR